MTALKSFEGVARGPKLTSGGRPVEPLSRDLPLWVSTVLEGSHEKNDIVVQSSRVSKNPARWIRFLLLLCGDIDPHPGPSKQSAPRKTRGAMDLSVVFAKETSTRMRRCVGAFQVWCQEELQISFKQLRSDDRGTA